MHGIHNNVIPDFDRRIYDDLEHQNLYVLDLDCNYAIEILRQVSNAFKTFIIFLLYFPRFFVNTTWIQTYRVIDSRVKKIKSLLSLLININNLDRDSNNVYSPMLNKFCTINYD